MFVAFVLAVQIVMLERGNINNLGDWFFKTSDVVLHFPVFTAALMVLFVPFISSTVFYFTLVRYNSFFLMLTCMTTFALYAKTFTPIPFIYPSLIIAAFLFVSIEQRWYTVAANRALSYRKFVIIGVCFVAGAAYIAGFFPQAAHTPYREDFDKFISGRHWDAAIPMMDTIIDAPRSGQNNPNADRERILFTISFDDNNGDFTRDEFALRPRYLRRQVFDYWSGEYWEFRDHDRPHTLHTKEFPNRVHAYPSVTAEIKVATDTFLSFAPMPPNPLRAEYTYTTATDWEPIFFVNIRDEFIGIALEAGTSYRVEIPRFGGNSNSARPARHFPREYADYLASTLDVPFYGGQQMLRELAREITADLESDFDKAYALEQYFYQAENGFKYDLGFVPQRKSMCYFMFETKTGTCSDFATAMTLMAREIGLPARYVEGYIIEELNSNGEYVIRVKHSHAFTEVLIEGEGWVIFEPTIPGDGNGRGGIGYLGILTILGILGGLAILALVFVLIVLPKIKEKNFKKIAAHSPREKQVQLFYNKIMLMLMNKLRLNERTLSSRDLDCIACTEYGVQLGELTESYDRVVYGGLEVENNCDFLGVYTGFCEAVRVKSKERKR
jgi:transglutaminase-like putative cysteine protease